MKALIPLMLYAFLSGVIGLVACGLLLWKGKRPRAAAIAAAIFFGGPLVVYGYLSFNERHQETQYKEDIAYVMDLCAKYGGDKIYKTVDDVQGVFQMKSRNPDPDKQWADQYGMVEPWALAFGDRERNPIPLGTKGKGYWFVEQRPIFGQGEGPPFRRDVLVTTGLKVRDKFPYGDNLDDPLFDMKSMSVLKLRSRYGYTTEDLTTPELRKRWISGGRLKIIDLQKNEVIAERTDYYRATGSAVKLAWSAGVSCPPSLKKFTNTSSPGFILAVLRPPMELPTERQLFQLKGE